MFGVFCCFIFVKYCYDFNDRRPLCVYNITYQLLIKFAKRNSNINANDNDNITAYCYPLKTQLSYL